MPIITKSRHAVNLRPAVARQAFNNDAIALDRAILPSCHERMPKLVIDDYDVELQHLLPGIKLAPYPEMRLCVRLLLQEDQLLCR